MTRLLIATMVAYVLIGVVYATLWTIYLLVPDLAHQGDVAPPWSSPMAFLAWFVLPAALWPWNLVGFHGVPEFFVACLYPAIVGLLYLAASRRSAPRHLKSSYPDNH